MLEHARHAQRSPQVHARILASSDRPYWSAGRRVTSPGRSRRRARALARLIHEIEVLEPLIATAKSQASPDARIRFRYDWLRQDLERIRSGIQEHIDAPRNEPRKVPPLRGDYRQ